MSREAYQVPTAVQVPLPGRDVANDFGADPEGGYKITYFCAECASDTTLAKGDPIRCRECGHRVLYKKRTKR